MLRYYKKPTGIYIMLCTLALVLFLVCVIPNDNLPFLVCLILYLFMLCIILFAGKFASRLALSEHNRIQKTLDEQCDPQAYIDSLAPMMKRAMKVEKITNGASYYGAMLRLNRAVALAALGEFDEAIEETDKVLSLAATDKYRIIKMMGCHNLASFYRTRAGEGDFETAREKLSTAKDLLRELQPTLSTNFPTYHNIICCMEHSIDIDESKNLESAREFFKKQLEFPTGTRAELSYRDALARICLALGETDAAKEQFAVIAQKGSKTYLGREAAKKLA